MSFVSKNSQSDSENIKSLQSDNLISSADFEDAGILLGFINMALAADPKAKKYLPITAFNLEKTMSKLSDGVVLCMFFNRFIPNCLDIRVITWNPQSQLDKLDNLNLCINSGRASGCRLNSVDTKEMEKGNATQILTFLWEVVKIGTYNKMRNHRSQLENIRQPNEELKDVAQLPPDLVLIRWVNYTLREEQMQPVRSITNDFRDSVVYVKLLHELAPSLISTSILKEIDNYKRAERVVESMHSMRFPRLISAKGIVEGIYWQNFLVLSTLFLASQ
eukprot:TRINITY_DN3278_c0_g1_i1.p1 TRINITY_DN3278_c0_g1~~TRINITY_DN3278_c0_g1_i1.p1  ORF type:complete len:276 (+),score=35.07 TRINITY_DN3278_c0_g1_i1:415-1242(+)